MNRIRVQACCAFAALLLAACSDGRDVASVEPVEPGTVTLRWLTPHDEEGAVRLVIKGNVRAITSAQSTATAFARSHETHHQVAVIGTIREGALLRLELDDISDADDVVVELVEVADASDSALRADLTGYSLSIER